MSRRSMLMPLLRQSFRVSTSTRTPLCRCLHNAPTRPRTLPNLPRPLQQQPKRNLAKDSTGSIYGNARVLYHEHPFQFSLAIAIILAGAGSLVYVNWYYQRVIIGAYHNFPEPVAAKLRRAIHFSKTDIQPTEAIKYFRQALQIAEEMGMDPMSDEVMGVKIEVAAMLERCYNWGKAIEVLERVRADNMAWLEIWGEKPENKVKRTRVLKRTTAVNVKLAEHYANPAIWDRETAQERLVWAVETSFKEQQRRNNLGLSPERLDEQEGPFMSDDEIGATVEALAQSYAEKEAHYLAVPLYLKALEFKGTTDCHSVTLMSNLASSLAQQSPRAARAANAFAQSRNIQSPSAPSGPVATKETMVQNAHVWAQKALKLAREIQPPLRDEECDVGCAVATHNLGEMAEMLGKQDEARKRYEEAVGLSRAVGYQEGVKRSSARLKGLDKAG